jgi:aminobenzoyl-glutamate transport protein
VLVFMQRYMPKAGMGSVVALMLPYAITFLIVWTAMLLLWIGLDAPLGPGHEPLFIDAVR